MRKRFSEMKKDTNWGPWGQSVRGGTSATYLYSGSWAISTEPPGTRGKNQESHGINHIFLAKEATLLESGWGRELWDFCRDGHDAPWVYKFGVKLLEALTGRASFYDEASWICVSGFTANWTEEHSRDKYYSSDAFEDGKSGRELFCQEIFYCQRVPAFS